MTTYCSSPLCVAEVAATEGRHKQAAILVPKLNHSGVNSGDGLNREDNECWSLDTKKKQSYTALLWMMNYQKVLNIEDWGTASRSDTGSFCWTTKKCRKKIYKLSASDYSYFSCEWKGFFKILQFVSQSHLTAVAQTQIWQNNCSLLIAIAYILHTGQLFSIFQTQVLRLYFWQVVDFSLGWKSTSKRKNSISSMMYMYIGLGTQSTSAKWSHLLCRNQSLQKVFSSRLIFFSIFALQSFHPLFFPEHLLVH